MKRRGVGGQAGKLNLRTYIVNELNMVEVGAVLTEHELEIPDAKFPVTKQ